jgi:hypothetical protein
MNYKKVYLFTLARFFAEPENLFFCRAGKFLLKNAVEYGILLNNHAFGRIRATKYTAIKR